MSKVELLYNKSSGNMVRLKEGRYTAVSSRSTSITFNNQVKHDKPFPCSTHTSLAWLNPLTSKTYLGHFDRPVFVS